MKNNETGSVRSRMVGGVETGQEGGHKKSSDLGETGLKSLLWCDV